MGALRRYDLRSETWPGERLPESLRGRPCVVGIDEAGRGPVLGPLVYALFVAPAEDAETLLAAAGAADSKALTAARREAFFSALLSDARYAGVGWTTTAVHPERISHAMLGAPRTNLNELSFATVYGLVERVLAAGVSVAAGFVDTLGRPEAYAARLSGRFPGPRWTVAPRADARFPVVGAASIVAKVLRDDVLSAALGVPRGLSGYPSDAQTVAHVRALHDAVFGFPAAVRFSWGSCSALLAACVPVRWPPGATWDGANAPGDGGGGASVSAPKKRTLAKKRPAPDAVPEHSESSAPPPFALSRVRLV